MSIWNFDADLFPSSLDIFLGIAVICTLFVVIITFYLNAARPSAAKHPLSQQTERYEVNVKPKVVKRIDSGDGPHRGAGRRRRREDNTTAPTVQATSPGISPAHLTPVSVPEAVSDMPEIGTKESSRIETGNHQLSNLIEPDYVKSKAVSPTSRSEPDKVLYTTNERTVTVGPKPSTDAKRSTDFEDSKPTAVKPEMECVHPCPQSPSTVFSTNDSVPDTINEWRDVNPRRRERQKQRVLSKPSETGTPVPCPNLEPDAPSSVSMTAEVNADEQVPLTLSESLPSTQLKTDHPDRSRQHMESIQMRTDNQEEPKLCEEPSEPTSEASGKKPPSKTAKSRRKRRNNAATKLSNVTDLEPCVTTPPVTLGTHDAVATVSPAGSHRSTPDDSEFELIELSGLVSNPSDDADTSLGPDWGLTQPIPCTGDMREFPCLPGAESQFAIVHPTDSQHNSLECSRHPQAGHLLKSALTEPDDDYTVGTVGVHAEEPQPAVPTTKATVKRSKARRAD